MTASRKAFLGSTGKRTMSALLYWTFPDAKTPEFVQDKRAFRQTNSHQKRKKTRKNCLGPQIQLHPSGVQHTKSPWTSTDQAFRRKLVSSWPLYWKFISDPRSLNNYKNPSNPLTKFYSEELLLSPWTSEEFKECNTFQPNYLKKEPWWEQS